ncbi:hypothetical protein HTG_11295 [Natrinema mahii]|nr:hypothetical protein HTG_11295 [Natrinema mahii]
MSETKGESPLHVEGQYSGKIFWLNIPTGYTLDLQTLREELHNHTFYESISTDIDTDTTFVPDIFKQDGEVVRTTSIDEAQLVTSPKGKEAILGTIVIDKDKTVKYRGQQILVLDNTEARFLIFNHQNHYYLCILGAREVAEGAAAILRSEHDDLGSTINKTRLDHNALKQVRESLNAKLMDTIIGDYPEKELTSVQMKGDGLEEVDDYQRQRSRGKLKTHMFQTQELVGGTTLTVGMSRDGLIRIYSTATISTYLELLVNHVLPVIHRDVETTISLTTQAEAASNDSIYKAIEEDD